MNWITIICSMIAASCLTVAGIHLLVWLRSRRAWSNLLLSNCALTAAAIVGFDIALMHSRSATESAALLRWMYLPLSWGLVSLLLFVRQYLEAGRDWLLWTAIGVRVVTLVLNFASPVSLIMRSVTAIEPTTILGETVSVPVGVMNHWMLLGNFGVALVIAYLVDASVLAWRQGRRKPALVVSAVLAPALLVSLIRALMVVWGGPSVPTPYLISLAPLAVMLVMSFALSSELLRADALARELRESRERMTLATRELDRVSRLTAMGEFAATIAHETVQPITAIMANAQAGLRALSRNAAGLDDARDSLLSVAELGRRVAEVLQRNRELFQHRTVRRAPLDINDVIEEARSLAEWRLDDNAVSVDVVLTRPLPTLSGDRVELQQVLLNLIANAIDAVQSCPAPRIRIRSSIDGHEVRVEVADNGVGLGGVDVARMFALSYTTKPEGTGVGLSVSRAIVDAHGGRIWAEPNADGGASLFFAIPSAVHDVPALSLAAAHKSEGVSTTADATV